MKKLIIIPLLLIAFAVSGQIGRYPFARAVAVAEEEPSGPPDFLSSDGYTEMWFMVEDGSSTYMTLDESVVTAWQDQSSNNADVVNATGTDRPTYDSENGEIDFDGTDDYLSLASFAQNQPVFVYAVIRFNTYTASDQIFRIADYGGGRMEQSANYATALSVIGGGTNFDSNQSFYSTATYYVLRVLWNNNVENGSLIQLNANTAAVGTLGVDAAEYFNIGYSGNPPDMSIKEVIVRSVADDSEDQTAIVNYLNDKYSVY